MGRSPVPAIDRIEAGTAELPRSQRLGVLTNRAAQATDGQWSGSLLIERGYSIGVLLTPEHGLAVDAAAGAAVGHSRIGDIPVLSMYGADASPIEDAMPAIDALVVDLPDVGCRYYTYGWTVRELLKLAARHEKPVHILDRPNPLGGVAIEGSKPDAGFDSAVCASSVPVRHGLTLAELALWHRRDLDLHVDISTVTVQDWRRDMTWFETKLPWVPPSPAIRNVEAAFLYPGTCLLEGTNLSEGRGTDEPFATAGAPFVDGKWLANRLTEDDSWAGVGVESIIFTPQASKWAGQRCEGVRFTLQDRSRFRPVQAGLALIAALMTYGDFTFLPGHFDVLAGTKSWRDCLTRGVPAAEIAAEWRGDETAFQMEREDILLY